MRRQKAGLEAPQDIILRTIHKMGPASEQKFFAHAVLVNWLEIAGDFIAGHTEPQGIRQGVLYLYSPNSTLRNELKLMEPRLVQNVNNYAGMELIKSIAFTRRWEHPDSEGIEEMRAADREAAATHIDYRRELKKVTLPSSDIEQAKRLASVISDERLAALAQLLYQKHLQRQYLDKRYGYTPCKNCGALVEPGETICYSCYRRGKEELLTRVRSLLKEMPWARIADVRKFIPECSPRVLNHERAAMVNVLASRVMVGDTESVEAMTLVMLATCVPPDKLTAEKVAKTIYRLRFQLVKPPDYHAPKRYDVIKLGKKGKGEK